MFKNRRLLLLFTLLLLFVTAVGVVAQQGGGYDLTWNTIDGGGGTSSGGGYEVSGTAGQADAGTSSGGGYTLEGGFWPGASCTAVEPLVSASVPADNQVSLSWPVSSSVVVFRAGDPYFVGGVQIGETTGTGFTDTNATGIDVSEVAYYYDVVAGGCAVGNRVGAFTVALVPGT